MGTTYKVEIELSTKGSLNQQLEGTRVRISSADSAASKLLGSLRSLGSQAMAPLDAVASKIWTIGSHLAVVGGGAAFAGLTYGATQFNAELEKAQITLGTIMNAQGAATSIYQGLDMAGSVMSQMRKDAAALPGEFSDLMNIFTTSATSGFRTGASVQQLRAMAAQVMAAGATVAMPLDQVAREYAMLLEGRSGAHNVFGMRVMGLSGTAAEEFNKTKPEERLELIGSALAKYAPAMQVYKTSFEGLSSTLADNAKLVVGTATQPLFERAKSNLIWVNDWFEKNDTLISTKAQAIGSHLAYAFDKGKAALVEWWPAIETFASNAYARLVEIWRDIGPAVKDALGGVKDFLKDPAAFDKILTVAKVYGGLKVGGAVAGAGFGMAGDVLQVAGAAKQMGWIGGAAKAAEGAGGAAQLLSASGGIAKLGEAASKAAVPLLAIAAAGATWSMAYDQFTKLTPEWNKHFGGDDSAARITYASNMAAKFGGDLSAAAYASEDFQSVLRGAIDSGDSLTASLMMLKTSADTAAGSLANIALARARQEERNDAMAAGYLSQMTGATTTALINGAFEKAQAAQSKKPGSHPGGGGGTNVQKVEIVVTSNQEPSRIARMVLSQIQDLQRHPRVSRSVPNYSASRS